MKKCLGLLCMICWCSSSIAEEDRRFIEPKKKVEFRQVHNFEHVLLSIKGRYENLRTLRQIDDQTRFALDVKGSNLWLTYEKAI